MLKFKIIIYETSVGHENQAYNSHWIELEKKNESTMLQEITQARVLRNFLGNKRWV